jgi:hypothetical protein
MSNVKTAAPESGGKPGLSKKIVIAIVTGLVVVAALALVACTAPTSQPSTAEDPSRPTEVVTPEEPVVVDPIDPFGSFTEHRSTWSNAALSPLSWDLRVRTYTGVASQGATQPYFFPGSSTSSYVLPEVEEGLLYLPVDVITNITANNPKGETLFYQLVASPLSAGQRLLVLENGTWRDLGSESIYRLEDKPSQSGDINVISVVLVTPATSATGVQLTGSTIGQTTGGVSITVESQQTTAGYSFVMTDYTPK